MVQRHLWIAIPLLLLGLFGRFNLSQHGRLQRIGLSHPGSTLGMITFVFARVWMDQSRKGTAIDDEPGDKGSELLWCKNVDFKHCYGVRTYGTVPEGVDSQFRDWWAVLVKRTGRGG